MRKLTVPTLVMTGDEDDPCLEPGLMMKRTIATAGLAVLPRSGQAINLEQPDAAGSRTVEAGIHQDDGIRNVPGSQRVQTRHAPASQQLVLPIASVLGCGQWAIRTGPIVAHAADREAIQLRGVLSGQQLTYQRFKSLPFSRRQHLQK